MRITAENTLTATEKTALRTWLGRCLDHPTLCGGNIPINQRLALYVDGKPKVLVQNYWDNSSIATLGLANDPGTTDTPRLQLHERIAVLATITSLVGGWEQLADKFSTAISRILLEQYHTMMGGLVQTPNGTQVTRLAFSADRHQVAGRVDDRWYLPSGAEVDVSGEGWVIAE